MAPNLFHSSRLPIRSAPRTGWRCRASGSRGVPSATASTRSAWPSRSSGAMSLVVPPGSSGTASPHSTWPDSPVAAPRHVQGAARQPDVARRDLAERGGHQGGRGELAARQHRAVAEEPGEVVAEPPVVRGDDEPQLGVELLGAQRAVEVGQVIGAHQRHGAGGGDARVRERLAGQRGVLADDDAGQRRDLRPVVPELVGEQDDDVLAVAVGEFPGDAVGERVVAADDEVAPGHGGRGHGPDPIDWHSSAPVPRGPGSRRCQDGNAGMKGARPGAVAW